MSTERENAVREVFDTYDKDGDGFLSGAEELKAAFSDLDYEVTDEELKEIVAFADENSDGQVSFEEFLNFIP